MQKTHAICEFLQNIKKIHSILKGITTKKRKGRGKKRDTGQEETPEILSAFPPLDFCTCLYFRSEHSSGDGPVYLGDKFSKRFWVTSRKTFKSP